MSYLLYSICIIAVIAIDQITKIMAVKYLMPIHTYPLLENVFHLTYVENKGAAFGILQNHRWVFMIISTVVMAVIVFVMFKYKKFLHPIIMIGLSFTVGGGIGNMIDRTIKGFVVDFFDFTLIDFAVFNVADTFICIGVGLIFLDVLLGKSDYSFLDGEKQILDSEKDNKDETYTD
ncbi:MAG: signal peptidase II [Ruminococcaceae bacterium]|nr:signal peptidase II [Oscillospiraceae bacterium]